MLNQHLQIIDAREVTRLLQPGRALREVVVTITQTATGRRQAVRVAAADARAARALAMLHATLLSDAPRNFNPASLAARHLEFEVRPDDDGFVAAPGPAAPAVASSTAEPGGGPPVTTGEYAAYSVVIATDPHYWARGGAEPSLLESRRGAGLLADMARNVFPGLRCDLVPGPVEKLDLSFGPNAHVRESLEMWVDRRMAEMRITS